MIALFFIGSLALVAALTFSVEVSGDSMEPTLHTGDRLTTDIVGRHDISRFDLVETSAGANGISVVKRVIGMPGDRVTIEADPVLPRVLVQPADSTRTYLVANPTWPERIGQKTQACCEPDGTSSRTSRSRAVTIPKGSYWVLGDNWGASDDSRVFGFVTTKDIGAKLSFRILPASSFGRLRTGAHLVPQV